MSQLRTDTNKQNAVFARVPTISQPRNIFPLIKSGKTTHQFDLLHVLYTKEIYPGDTINFELRFFSRLQTQITDLFDDLYSDVHVWFGPNRLVQTNFARLFYDSQLTGPTQDNTALTTPKITPYLDGSTYKFQEKDLFDDMEYPTEVSLNRTSGGYVHMPNYKGRHYNNIFNLSYRDQNLQNARVVDYGDGPDNYADYATHAKRGKRHDMPTSCLPFLQKGTAPLVPLTGSVAVDTNNASPNFVGQTSGATGTLGFNPTIGVTGVSPNTGTFSTNEQIRWGSTTGLQVNFAAAAAGFYVNDMRYTLAVQHILEANARGGTRDVEALSNIWGVDVADFRMDRPEYLGGSTFMFDGHIVPQTSETGATPQATLASFSQQRGSMRIMHSFVEPGFLMILVSHRSNQTYQNFLKKEDTRRTRWDFYNPYLSAIGEVAVKTREIFVSGTEADDDDVFGYQPYGYELRYDINTVTREMRSNATLSLDSKHMAYDFSTSPVLNAAFIESYTPIERNITVSPEEVDPIQTNFIIDGTIARTLPMYGVPGLTRV